MMSRDAAPARHRSDGDERGYTMVALLALMTILALALTAVAPSIHQQARRELERESIARGEEVAEAIAAYHQARKTLPTSMEQLLEGLPLGTKKVHILRATAARDPLSSSGEWRLIRPNDAALMEFQKNLVIYAGGRPILKPPIAPNAGGAVGGSPPLPCGAGVVTNVTNTGGAEQPPGGEDESPNTTGPFIGVTSRSRRRSVLSYYGVERHDKWVFTPCFK